MDALNALLGRLFDLLLMPVAGAPAVALVVVSAAAGVVMTIVYRYASPQRALRRVADRSRAMLLGLRLFKDDIRVAFRYQGALLAATGRRLLLSLPPLAVLMVPFVLVLAQLALRYEYRPLVTGEAAVVEVAVKDADWPAWRDAALEAPAGLRVETPALRDDLAHTVSWRVRLEAPTAEPIAVRAGATRVEKTFRGVDDGRPLRAVSVQRPGRSLPARLLHPGEPALDRDAPVRAITVRYPRRSTPVFDLDLPWWLTFLIVSMATALLVRPVLRVQF